jgi:hypothetical protein
VLAARRPSSKHGRALAEEPSRRAQQTISPIGGVTAFAHEQPSVGVDAHDCFARRNVAELTIELATFRSPSISSGTSRSATATGAPYRLGVCNWPVLHTRVRAPLTARAASEPGIELSPKESVALN